MDGSDDEACQPAAKKMRTAGATMSSSARASAASSTPLQDDAQKVADSRARHNVEEYMKKAFGCAALQEALRVFLVGRHGEKRPNACINDFIELAVGDGRVQEAILRNEVTATNSASAFVALRAVGVTTDPSNMALMSP